MKKLPESFCVKANKGHKLWDKYIQWLNEKGEVFNGMANSYYGISNKSGVPRCWGISWGEVITLEQWHQAVNAKSDFPEPVFITKSGVEIYDEFEMLVWDSVEDDAYLRKVIAKTEHGYITLGHHGHMSLYDNAKPIPEEVEVTLEEIAKWKGVDVKQVNYPLPKAEGDSEVITPTNVGSSFRFLSLRPTDK